MTILEFPRSTGKISADIRKSRRVNNARFRVSARLQAHRVVASAESYIRAIDTRCTCDPRIQRDFATRAFVAIAALQLALRLRHCAHARETAPRPPSSCTARCSIAYRPKESSPDSKTFADAVAKSAPEEIMRRYEAEQDRAGFSLQDFVAENFVDSGRRGERIRDRAARRNPRAHRQAVGRADARRRRTHAARIRSFGSRPATWCPAGAFARCTTGIPTSRWWACRPAAATISWPTWSRTLPASSIGTDTFPTAAAAIT